MFLKSEQNDSIESKEYNQLDSCKKASVQQYTCTDHSCIKYLAGHIWDLCRKSETDYSIAGYRDMPLQEKRIHVLQMKLYSRREQKYIVGQINWGESRPSHVDITSDRRLRLISSFVLGSSQFVLLQGKTWSAILCIITSHRYIEPLSIPALLELLIAASTFAHEHTPPRNCKKVSSLETRDTKHISYPRTATVRSMFACQLLSPRPGPAFYPRFAK
jgi:hypothetical protein